MTVFLPLIICCINVSGQTDTILSKKYYELGLASYNKGEYRLAINFYDTSLFYNAINPLSLMNKGIAYNDLKINDSAILSFSKLIILAPSLSHIRDYSYLFYLRSNSYYNLKNYQRSLLDIDTFFIKRTTDDDLLPVYVLQGQCLYYLDKEDSAIISFNKAIALDSDNFTANLFLGRSYSKMDKEKARVYFTKALQLDNKSFDANKYWGYFENESGNYADAKVLLETALELAVVDEPQFYVNLAIAQAGAGDIAASMPNFTKAAADPTWKAQIPFKRMELFAANSNSLDETAQKVLLDDITYIATQYTKPIQKAELQFLKVYLQASWQYPPAQIIADVDEAIKLHPTEWKFYYFKALYTQNKKTKHKEAIALVDKAIKLKNSWKLQYSKASLYNDVGLKKEACVCIKKAQALPNEKNITTKMVADICKGIKITANLDLQINHIIENGELFK